MRTKLALFITIAILLVVAIVIASESKPLTENTSDAPVVAATVFPLANITSNIAGDLVDVRTILEPGASPHTFDPAPSTIRDLRGASTVFAIGYGLDDWAVDLADTIDAEVVVVDEQIDIREIDEDDHDDHEEEEHHDEDEHEHDEDAHNEEGHDDEEEHEDHHDEDEHEDEEGHEDEHDHDHGSEDPHYWLSFENGALIAQTITHELSELFPEHAATFEANLDAYLLMLDAAQEDAEQTLSALANRNIVTFHDAWYYFSEAFDLTVVGTYEPTAAREPTPNYLAELTEGLEAAGTTTIYSEPQFGTANLEAFADDNGLKIVELDPIGGVEGRDSYIDLILFNVEVIANNN